MKATYSINMSVPSTKNKNKTHDINQITNNNNNEVSSFLNRNKYYFNTYKENDKDFYKEIFKKFSNLNKTKMKPSQIQSNPREQSVFSNKSPKIVIKPKENSEEILKKTSSPIKNQRQTVGKSRKMSYQIENPDDVFNKLILNSNQNFNLNIPNTNTNTNKNSKAVSFIINNLYKIKNNHRKFRSLSIIDTNNMNNIKYMSKDLILKGNNQNSQEESKIVLQNMKRRSSKIKNSGKKNFFCCF